LNPLHNPLKEINRGEPPMNKLSTNGWKIIQDNMKKELTPEEQDLSVLLKIAGANVPLWRLHSLTIIFWGYFKFYKFRNFIDNIQKGMSWEFAYRKAKTTKKK
jgi:hypothetical protein